MPSTAAAENVHDEPNSAKSNTAKPDVGTAADDLYAPFADSVAANAPAPLYEHGDVGEDATANTETFEGFGVPGDDPGESYGVQQDFHGGKAPAGRSATLTSHHTVSGADLYGANQARQMPAAAPRAPILPLS